jgi:phosphoribosyl-ATP pyrophosphohydrolase
MIIPSIDLMGGKAVQLKRGKERVLERDDVFGIAERFSRVGELAVIDLDAALSQGDNRELVKQLCRRFPCRVGGGVRTVEVGRDLLAAGAKRIIVGTCATPEFLSQFKPEQVIAAVDEKDGEVAIQGWTEGTGVSAIDKVKELEPYCSGFLYTVVDREGMMGGTATGRIDAVREATERTVTAAGGISSTAEAVELIEGGCEVQLGMAIYTGAIQLEALFCRLVDFGKADGLVPTVVENESGQVLMLAYSSVESLGVALSEGRGVYWSRSRKQLWRKGDTSGHTQALIRARLDCDRDAIRFTVRQEGPACHTGADTCFGSLDPSLAEVEAVLRDRLENPTDSFGSQLMADERLIRRKIHEEAWELNDAGPGDDTLHEAADLLFFATALLVKRGHRWDEVLKVLRGRQR